MLSAGPRAVVSFFVPAGVALLLATAALHFGFLPLSDKVIDFYSYAVFGAAVLLAWRFHSSRMAVAAVSLALAQRGLLAVGTADLNVTWIAICMVSVLLPANFLLASLAPERGFRAAPLAFWAVLLGVEAAAVAGVCNADDRNFQLLFTARLAPWFHVPKLALALLLAAAAVLIGRYFLRRRPIEAGLVWGLVAATMAFHRGGATASAAIHFANAGMVLALSLVEASYFMAFHDELTGLPGRRAFNEEVLAIEGQFCVAVVDIDHFKQFNDTFGHETGDQVLRMVASRLSRVTGGGKAFRTGGEEFCVLFRNLGLREALPHLDALREAVEQSIFVIRGADRPLRTPEDRRAQPQRDTAVAVTVSIGAAQSSSRLISIEDVLRGADKALYQAKADGRNRVEVYRAARRARDGKWQLANDKARIAE